TPPTLTIDSPLAQEYATNTITITLSGADDYWYYMEPVDTQNQTWTGDVTRTLIIDGVYTLHAYGNDSVGNIAEKTISFTIDTAPPTITIDSPAATTYTTGTITVELSSDDAVHYWYYILDIDGANLTWTSGTSRSLDDGMTYTLYAYGNDSVGNVGYASVTFTIEIPTTTPPKETTPETSIATTTTTSEGEIGSFPGHLAVLLFVTILVVVFRRHKKI
ncbi:MAG: Ig-like domain-containing protein, partial [Candidatus Hodarchaeota archaeon]